MLIWFIFSFAVYYGRIGTYGPIGGTLLLFILFLLLGWHAFGPPIHG